MDKHGSDRLNMVWRGLISFHQSEVDFLHAETYWIVTIALLGIIPGAFLGWIGWWLKVVWLTMSLVISAMLLLRLSIRRAIIGAEVGALIEVAHHDGPDALVGVPSWLTKILMRGVDNYIRFIGAVLASEMTVGLIVLWIPAHRDPVAALLIIPGALALIGYTIWKQDDFLWPKLVYGLALGTIVVGLCTIFFPETIKIIVSDINVDKSIATLINAKKAGDSANAFPLSYPFIAIAVFFGVVITVFLLRRSNSQQETAHTASSNIIMSMILLLLFLTILAVIGYGTYLIIQGGGLNVDGAWQTIKNLFPTTEDGWAILIASFGVLTFFLFYKEKYKFGSILLLIFLTMWVGRNQWYDSRHTGPPQAVRGGITTGHTQDTNPYSTKQPLENGWVADADENCSPTGHRRPITVLTRHNRSGADIQYRVSSTNWRYEWNSKGSGTWQQVLSRNNSGALLGFKKIQENKVYAMYCGKSGYMPGGVQKWKNEVLMIRKEVK